MISEEKFLVSLRDFFAGLVDGDELIYENEILTVNKSDGPGCCGQGCCLQSIDIGNYKEVFEWLGVE